MSKIAFNGVESLHLTDREDRGPRRKKIIHQLDCKNSGYPHQWRMIRLLSIE